MAYHLHRLEGDGLIGSRIVHGRKHYFAFGAKGSQQVVLLSSRKRELFELLQKHPGINEAGLSGLLGVNSKTVSFHLQGLRSLGLVGSERAGRQLRWYPDGGFLNF